MTTTEAGTILTVFGTDVTGTILAIVGDHAEDFDLEAAANGYRDYLAGFLPDGYTISGHQIIKDVNVPHLDRDAIREAVADDAAAGEGFDISQYAKDEQPASADADPNPDDELRASRAEARDVAQKTFNIARGMVDRARRLAARGNASSYRAASEVMQSANYTYRSARATFRWLEDDKNADLCGNLMGITSGLSEKCERVANELDDVNGLLARLEP